MPIKVDYVALRSISNTIASLKNEALEISDSLQESLGKTTEMEKKVISALSQICTTTFPAMIDSSSKLLYAIANEFERKDKKLGGK